MHELSRTALDVIQYAHRKGVPLIPISTDSISMDHIEACFDLYEFPEAFKIALMCLSLKGTLSFEVNSTISQDYEVEAGVCQGDPRSTFNLAAAPLNHFLATSPSVPRCKIEDDEAAPIFFTDDNFMLLDGRVESIERKIQLILKEWTCTYSNQGNFGCTPRTI